jgi:tetraacyldisaccharide 4'-kinase
MSGPERHWQRLTPLSILLFPVSLLFRAVVAARRAAYVAGVLRATRLAVPVIVVGNVTVGGTGKTPLVLWLAKFLRENGMRPGIVSRGYGARSGRARAVTPDADAGEVGDEPLLLAQRSGCPVWIGADRAAAATSLLETHRSCDVIVSDDGLQHYALARDFEIAVVDSARGLGNGLMLPAGPLREPPSRLREVDAVVINRSPRETQGSIPGIVMTLEGSRFRNLLDPDHVAGPSHFQRLRVHAVAGIGNPARFFAHLEALGLAFRAHAFADHHRYTAADLAFDDCDAVVMTEKDAVKCAPFANETHWALRVDAQPDPELGELVVAKLANRNPRSTR